MRRRVRSNHRNFTLESLEFRDLPTSTLVALIDSGVYAAANQTSSYYDIASGYNSASNQTVAVAGTSIVEEGGNHGHAVADNIINQRHQGRREPIQCRCA